MWSSFPVAMSKKLMIPSIAPLAKYFPSGLWRAKQFRPHYVIQYNIINVDMQYKLLKTTTGPGEKGLHVEKHKSKLVIVKPGHWGLSPYETELEEPPPRWQWQFMVPYVSYTQDEFPSSVQWKFLLATFHAKDVDLAEMASCGDVFRVWGEGDRPRIN